MIHVDESDHAGCVLKLMVLAIGGEIDIGALRYGFADELRSASAAEGDGLDCLFRRRRIADVGAVQDVAYLSDEIEIIDCFRQRADDTESGFSVSRRR